MADGENARFVRDAKAFDRGCSANTYGDKRFDRSERGWPIVDISQLEKGASAEVNSLGCRSHFTLEADLLKDSNDPRLHLVVHQIINFVIAVDQSGSIFRLGPWVTEKGNHFIKMGYLANSDMGVNISSSRLGFRNSAEGLKLTVVKAR